MEQSNTITCSLTNEELIDRIIQYELDAQDLKQLEQFFWDCQYDFYKKESREDLINAAQYYKLELT
jgi:hypothetical protein